MIRLHVICFNAKPITLGRIADLDDKELKSSTPARARWKLTDEEAESILTARTGAAVKRHYLHYVGYTWAERRKGIEVFELVCDAMIKGTER